MDGGGGTIVLTQENDMVLLDLLNHLDQTRQAPRNSRENIPVYRFKRNFQGAYGFIKASELQSYQFAISRVEAWAQESYMLSHLLKQTLTNMKFLVGRNVRPTLKYHLDPADQSKVKRLIPVAQYIPSLNAALVDLGKFKQLDLYSQSALLIHESLRYIQNMDGSGNGLDEKSLQEITAQLIFGTPDSRYNDIDSFSSESLRSYIAGDLNYNYREGCAQILITAHQLNNSYLHQVHRDSCSPIPAVLTIDLYLQNLKSKVYQHRAQLYREARTQEEAGRVHQLSDKLETGFLRIATGMLTPNNIIYSNVIQGLRQLMTDDPQISNFFTR